MLARLPDRRSEQESEGNMAAQITERWICKQPDCRGYGFVCYWAVRDNPEYHLPVKGTHLTAWSAAIDRGEITAEQPSPSLIQQMQQAANRSKVTKKDTIAAPTTPAGTHFSFAFNRSGTSSGSVVGAAPTPPMSGSSPLRMPVTQSSAVDLREEFIRWCIAQDCWRSEQARLETMLLVFDEQGFDVEGIASATAEVWKEVGIAAGYRLRMKKAAKQWLYSRGGRESISDED
jgi:hypothetical protein